MNESRKGKNIKMIKRIDPKLTFSENVKKKSI